MAKKTFYKKRRFYNKRTYKKTGVPRTITSDIVYRKCEYYNNILVSNGDDHVTFNGTSNYLLISNMLSQSATWSQTYQDYMRFKIYGILIEYFSSCSDSQISQFMGVYPMFRCALYPQDKGLDKGSKPLQTDSGFNINTKQNYVRKYYALPEGFINSNNVTSLGNWNETATYATMDGQVSIYRTSPTFVASNNLALSNVKITMYVAFSGQQN